MCKLNSDLVFTTLSVVTIRFDKTVYRVVESERGSSVDVCAVMHNGTPPDRLVDFEFDIIFSTSDGTAGT